MNYRRLASQPDTEVDSKFKKKNPTVRKGLNPGIPRIQLRIELSNEDKEGAIDTFFVKVKKERDIIPAQVQVVELMQEKAVSLNKDCPADKSERKMISAALPRHPLPKAVVSINTLANG